MTIRLFIPAICILVSGTSCLKKYSCKCTTSLAQPGYYIHKTESVQEIEKHSSKKKATQICDNTAKQVQANADLLYPDYVEVSTACELKDY